MAIVYVPINNAQLSISEETERKIMGKILTEVNKSHASEDASFKAEILLYTSKPARGMITTLLKSQYAWIDQINISIDPKFDQKGLDEIARRMTGKTSLKGVLCFRIIPRGLLEKRQASEMQSKLLEDFGEVYLIDIPEAPSKVVEK